MALSELKSESVEVASHPANIKTLTKFTGIFILKVIMPGVTHWHHPQFHAYFPTANSYPAIVADILR